MLSIKPNEFYATSDMSLGAALIYFGYPIEQVEKEPHTSKCFFYFKNDQKLKNLIESFLKHKLSVEPMKYFNSIKEIKSRLKNNFS